MIPQTLEKLRYLQSYVTTTAYIIKAYVNNLFMWQRQVQEDKLTPEHTTSEPEPEAKKNNPSWTKAGRSEHAEAGGRYYYFSDLLDSLDNTFECLRLLRKCDPDAYQLYSRVGATFSPKNTQILTDDVEPMFRKFENFPSFFMTTLGDGKCSTDKNKISARAVYFQKLSKIPAVQRVDGIVYSGALFYADKNEEKLRISAQMFVGVTRAGEVIPLKVNMAWPQVIKHKHKRKNLRSTTVVHHKFEYPDIIKEISKENNVGVKSLILRMFYLALNNSVNAESGITVIVRKGKLSARFAIDMLRTPYFFKDRERTVAGKKIFHIVRPHERVTNGKTRIVRSHCRGEREFMWKGYKVTVTLPGLHYNPLYEATFTSYDEFDTEGPKEKLTTSAGVGMMMQATLLGKPQPTRLPTI